MRYTFDELMQLAENEAGGYDVPTRPAIIKELLHYDILLALSRSQLAETLVFQGGTALRLCYGGQRYSEDLDFVCGAFAGEPFSLGDMEQLLREHVSERSCFGVTVKTPGENKTFDSDEVTVKRWSFNINVPGFVAAQKIHFEVCNVPFYDAAPMLLQPRYDFLSDVYSDIALRVESRAEIMADKVVALIARRHLKARDLWDLHWLAGKGIEPDYALVRSKLDDYGVEDVEDKIAIAHARLQDRATPGQFVDEMKRFVTPSVATRLFGSQGQPLPWVATAQQTLEQARNELRSDAAPRA